MLHQAGVKGAFDDSARVNQVFVLLLQLLWRHKTHKSWARASVVRGSRHTLASFDLSHITYRHVSATWMSLAADAYDADSRLVKLRSPSSTHHLLNISTSPIT